jgi:hypothetical protein
MELGREAGCLESPLHLGPPAPLLPYSLLLAPTHRFAQSLSSWYSIPLPDEGQHLLTLVLSAPGFDRGQSRGKEAMA